MSYDYPQIMSSIVPIEFDEIIDILAYPLLYTLYDDDYMKPNFNAVSARG